jgi:hypothetical protein
MSKYSTFEQYLRRQNVSRLTMDFEEISGIVGGLPASAFRYDEWWANDESRTHVQANAWLDAGWRVSRVDMRAKRVTLALDESIG